MARRGSFRARRLPASGTYATLHARQRARRRGDLWPAELRPRSVHRSHRTSAQGRRAQAPREPRDRRAKTRRDHDAQRLHGERPVDGARVHRQQPLPEASLRVASRGDR